MSGRADRVREVLRWLERHGTAKTRDAMGPKYGIHTTKAFGVAVGTMRQEAKRLGADHDLAEALWPAEWYEARMMAVFLDEPAKVTPAQMQRWAKDFDNWAICDTACFHLFDRTPHAWAKIEAWSTSKQEFVKRAAFALLASVALHDKAAADAPFVASLKWIERAAADDRHFVKKGVNWALRSIGGRNAAMHAKAIVLSERLAVSEDAAPRWIGKDALRQLRKKTPKARTAPSVTKSVKKVAKASAKKTPRAK